MDESIDIPDLNSLDDTLSWCEQVLQLNPKAFSLILIEKTSFTLDQETKLLDSFTDSESLGETDVYYRNLFSSDLAGRIQVTRIEPCTIIHIKKYSEAPRKLVTESYSDYLTKVLPFINSLPLERTAWVHKVIKGESKENILYQEMDVETGFVIVPDLKWDQKAIEKLYLLVIARNAGIKSLRDLNERHIEFLKNIRVQTYQLLKDQYKLSWKDVRLLVHYQPSYYHFHIHIIHVEISGLSGTIVGQCHLLDDIIDNLETDPAYFQKKTLRYALSVLHPLYDLLSQGS